MPTWGMVRSSPAQVVGLTLLVVHFNRRVGAGEALA